MVQIREILAVYNPQLPQEALAVRLLVGSGVRPRNSVDWLCWRLTGSPT